VFNKLALTSLLTLSTLSVSAATIAIIDSGTDMKHDMIAPKAWINAKEIPGNNRDEDRNGYQDDVYGWNFAEQNSEVIDYKYLGTLNDDIRKFFNIQDRAMRGLAGQDEIDWMKEIVKDQEFIKRISIYGNFMHGTHVAGISARMSDDSKILAVKLIPTEVKLPGQDKLRQKGFVDKLVKAGIDALANAQMMMMEEIGYYVGDHGARVANGSFGTGYPQAKMIITNLYKTIMRKEPTPEIVDIYAKYFLNSLIKHGIKMPKAAPNTLFVFAAGNDGLNNDIFPTSPTNLQADNVISVAASIDYDAIAPFSNYGEKMVDVAAPGVGITSAAPGDNYVKVSGTSQASPYVAGLAGRVLDINKELTPKQVKEIIMKTVDKKGFLKGKVATSGIVNNERAVRAATLSLSMSVGEAISQAKTDIHDVVSVKSLVKGAKLIPGSVLPLPSMFK
jgi:subtilisin family serine protease